MPGNPSPRIVVLLPPSEGKVAGGVGLPWRPGTTSMAMLDRARLQVLDALGGDVAAGPTRPAIERYSGVLYRELGWPSLTKLQQRRGETGLLTVSALWGVVGPTDRIPFYKLKMSASLPGLGKLSTWWRPQLTEALDMRLRSRNVWDLLPQEHAAAWTPAETRHWRRFTVRFVDSEGATVAHWNKLLKGALVRRLLEDPVEDPWVLADWRHPAGYRLDRRATEELGDGALALTFREQRRR